MNGQSNTMKALSLSSFSLLFLPARLADARGAPGRKRKRKRKEKEPGGRIP